MKGGIMKRKIPCLCDRVFEVDVPEEINLDTDPARLDEIKDGSFFNFFCPACGKKHKPEFPLSILWPSKNLRFEVLPELERGGFYRRKKTSKQKGHDVAETIIGYPEMADRLTVINDGFEPAPIEAIKYYLQLKAEEQYPDEEIEIWYFGFSKTESFLEFHIHGIKENEVAVMKVPLSLYEKNLHDYKRNPKKEIFSILRVQTYLSVKNTMRREALK
jgi:phage pi2 protein 07